MFLQPILELDLTKGNDEENYTLDDTPFDEEEPTVGENDTNDESSTETTNEEPGSEDTTSNEEDTTNEDETEDYGLDSGFDDENADSESTSEDDTSIDDYTDDGGEDNSISGQLKSIEKDMLSDLSQEQIDIRDTELKRLYGKLYDNVVAIRSDIKTISISYELVKVYTFVNKTLDTLEETLVDYLKETYTTKSYIENYENYVNYLTTLEYINKLLIQITPKNES